MEMNDMKNSLQAILIAVSVLSAGLPSASAQSNQDSSPSAGDQFKNGAQRIGEGATNIGEGIKQGAIQTWEAVKAGANAASDKFNGRTAEPPRKPMPLSNDDAN
jgi:hypothetical protein